MSKAGTRPLHPLAGFRDFIVRYRFLHLLVLPGLVYFLLFHYLPMLGLAIAFKDYRGLGGIAGIFQSPWVGLQNFGNFFSSHYFWRLLRNTLLISFYRLVFVFPMPIMLALLLNEVTNPLAKRTVQTISYLPHFISWVIVAGFMSTLLSVRGGPVNALLEMLGMKPIAFLSDNRYFRSVLVASSIWKETGWNSILFLAAIANIPPEQYEAAYLEGANRFQRMRYITVPSIAFIIAILLILRVGKIIEENFEQIFNLYNPTVYEVSDVFETYVYRRGIVQSDFSYAAAVGLFKSLASLILVSLTNRIARLMGQESLW